MHVCTQAPPKKKRNIRTRNLETIEDDEDVSVLLRKSSSNSGQVDSDSWKEESRVKDIEERDAFVERLKEKDKSKTRNVVERSNKKVSYNVYCFYIYSLIYYS